MFIKMWNLIAANWIIFLCFISSIDCEGEMTEDQKRDVLDGHNFYRNKLGWKDRNGNKLDRYAVNMRRLIWHRGLEQSALETAMLCKKDHLPLEGELKAEIKKELGSIGENLYGAGFKADRDLVEDFVKGWYEEIMFYDWEEFNCRPMGECGHLTQMLWHVTEFVGCAQYKCESSYASGRTNVWANFVCHYGPSGNWRGQRPFQTTASYDTEKICTDNLQVDPDYSRLCSRKPSTLGGELSETQKQQILDAHNLFRNNLGWKDKNDNRFTGFAVNMQRLFWHKDLETSAQEAADLCTKGETKVENSLLYLLHREFGGEIGENFYIGSGFKENATENFVKKWINQVKLFDWNTLTCENAGECDDLLQILWADTKYIGCAQQKCQNTWQSGRTATWTNFICRYGGAAETDEVPFQVVDQYDRTRICTGIYTSDVFFPNLCVTQ